MTILHTFAAHWLVHAMGWTLLNFCWQGIVVAAVLWSALQLLARRSAQVRYVAACGGLVLMVLLPLGTFARIAQDDLRATRAHAVAVAAAPGLTIGASTGDFTWLARLAAVLDPAIPWLFAAWTAGCVFCLFRLSMGFRVTLRLRGDSVSPAAADLQQRFAVLAHRLRISQPVVLLTSALVQAPTVIGWLRPVVLIPVGCFSGLPPQQIEAILCHELAHIRRHDYLVSVVQSVVEAVLFYHPAVWWVSQQLRRQRECCCDDIAVAVGGDALAYARALTALEAQRSAYPQVALGANGGLLTMRIKRLLIAETSSVASQAAAITVLALLTVAAFAVAGSARAQSQDRPVDAQVAAPIAAPAPLPALPPVPPPAPKPARGSALKPKPAPMPPVPPAPPMLAAAALPPLPPAEAIGQTQASSPLTVPAGVIAGQMLTKAAPTYPPDAKAAHIQGAVVLKAVISKDGTVENLQVLSGPKELQASAIDAVRQWTYKPYLLNGQPTEVETTITVNYHMAQ